MACCAPDRHQDLTRLGGHALPDVVPGDRFAQRRVAEGQVVAVRQQRLLKLRRDGIQVRRKLGERRGRPHREIDHVSLIDEEQAQDGALGHRRRIGLVPRHLGGTGGDPGAAATPAREPSIRAEPVVRGNHRRPTHRERAGKRTLRWHACSRRQQPLPDRILDRHGEPVMQRPSTLRPVSQPGRHGQRVRLSHLRML